MMSLYILNGIGISEKPYFKDRSLHLWHNPYASLINSLTAVSSLLALFENLLRFIPSLYEKIRDILNLLITNASTPTGVNAFFKLIFKELTPAGYAPH